MPASRLTLLVFAVLSSSCKLLRHAEPLPEKEVDHFKFWAVQVVPFADTVRLRGQFDSATWTARIESVQYLGNPVRKNSEPILDSTTHLVAYFLKQSERPQPRRWVKLSNQITRDSATWHLTDPALLLVPAGKSLSSTPPPAPGGKLSHFLCYVVLESPAIVKSYRLVDQFDVRREKVENVTHLEPAFFCVPVQKNGEPIRNEKVHLALYDLTPRDSLKPPVTVVTRDQLRTGPLQVIESLLLAVPSRKLSWGKEP